MDNPLRQLMLDDGKLVSDYANQNRILLRHTGYSMDKLPDNWQENFQLQQSLMKFIYV